MIQRWRNLPEAERRRRRWERIPRDTWESMAFEGEPVSLEMLEEAHARRQLPAISKPSPGSLNHSDLALSLAPPVSEIGEAMQAGEYDAREQEGKR